MSIKGIQHTLLFGKETGGWGVDPGATVSKYIGAVQSYRTNLEQGAKEIHGLGQAKSAAIVGGLLSPKLSFDFLSTNGRFMEYFIYGGATTHVDGTTDSVHTMVYAESLPSYSIEDTYQQVTDIENRWVGFISETCNLTLNVDGELTASVSGVAKDVDTSQTTGTTAVNQAEIPIKGFSGALNLGGAVSEAQSWTLNINRNAKLLHGLGTRLPVAGASHLLNVSFTARVAYAANTFDAAILGAAAGGTAAQPSAITAIFSADNGVAFDSGKRAMSITLSSCQYSAVTRDVPINDYIMVDINGVGKLGAGSFTDGVLEVSW